MTEKILFVDDEPNILAGFERQFRKRYTFDTAPGGAEGLAALAARGPYAVVVSDLRMPVTDGVQFLARVRDEHPTVVRVLLTGYADVRQAIEAVNRGVFRFLTKPCSTEALAAAVDAALAQYRLVTAEQELLAKTLRGSVQVLGEVLALTNPVAFERAIRVQQLVRELAPLVPGADAWEIDVAAVLSQLGCVAVPERVLAAADRGRELTEVEKGQLDAAPRLAVDLLRHIPRIEAVIDVITHQDRRFDDPDRAGRVGKLVPLGARLLKVARDFDVLTGRGLPRPQAFDLLRARTGCYDPDLLAALDQLIARAARPVDRVVPVFELTPDMIVADDLFNDTGTCLLRHGVPVSPSMKLRLESLAAGGHIPGKIRVWISPAGG